MKLYKFRSLQNLRRFLDILVNKRLYMAHFDEMNDPMEGVFLSDDRNRALLDDIWSGKRNKIICCFSKDYTHTLLWSHYADSHQGCCLEVEVTSRLKPHEVQYSPDIPRASFNDIDTIITHKSTYWQYEEEVRFIKNGLTDNFNKARPWLPIKITKVFLGYRMDKQDVQFYTSLIHSILGEGVEVRQMTRDDLDTGFD